MMTSSARRLASTLALFLLLAAGASRADDPVNQVYQLGPDSLPQPGVPQGTVTPWEQLPSRAYSGTLHDFCVYVPAQYDPKVPVALMVFQDGQAWLRDTGDLRATHVFDNLIYRQEIPVTIVVFINPGRTPEQPVASQNDWGDKSSNRPQEYNALDDKYTRVITEELLPVLAARYNLSKDPDDHAIGGASSGAIAAFTVAWQRPDAFRKVLSTIGSFTNIRGGDAYPDLIRQADRKPIRVYLLDGMNDNRGLRGKGPDAKYDPRWDWHLQNIRMAAALTEKGYDLNYCWGSGTHNNRQAGAALPEMLRWLWRDHPRVDRPQDPSNRQLLAVPGAATAPAVPAAVPPGGADSHPAPPAVEPGSARTAVTFDHRLGPGTSSFAGPLTFDNKWARHDPYLRRMVEAVQWQWDRLVIDGGTEPPPGTMTVRFTLDSHGKVTAIADVRNSATEQCKQYCLSAIRLSAPYGDWTSDMVAVLGKSQDLTFEFNYE